MKIAICISTRNRPKELAKCIHEWEKHVLCNQDTRLFIVDDASDNKYCDADYRFEERAGIPKVKNKCIALAIQWDADHIFLCDDDVWPLQYDAIRPYIDSPFKILCYTFYKPIMQGESHKYHIKGNGCMIYIHRDVIDSIGGFDIRFGLGKFEHTEYFERAHRFGLIPVKGFPFIDIANSHELFHSMDEHNEVKRSFSSEEMKELLNRNREHYYKTRFSTEFIPYK